jgi:hypothetical protein
VPSCLSLDVERETIAKIVADFRSERTLDAEISTAPAAAYVSVAILRDELSSEMANDGEFDSSMQPGSALSHLRTTGSGTAAGWVAPPKYPHRRQAHTDNHVI